MTEEKPTQKADAGNYRLPSDVTMKHAAKLAVVEDKPIYLIIGPHHLTRRRLLVPKRRPVRSC